MPPDFFDRVAAIGVMPEEADADRLDRFVSMLLERNKAFNLTAIRDESAAWERHILDSLSLVGLIAGLGLQSVADVGSGGGLPGIPLSICLPDVRFTLIEATGKKARFLEEVATDLGLDNVRVVHDRAETFGRPDGAGRGKFDLVIARAVGPMNVALELTAPLARLGGYMVLIKGAKAEQELEQATRAMHELRVEHMQTFNTPTGRIVMFGTSGKMPGKYPRLPGEPKRNPLV